MSNKILTVTPAPVEVTPTQTQVDSAVESYIDSNSDGGAFAKKYISNNLIPEEGILINYDFDNSTGEAVAVSSGLNRALTDYIPVKASTSYYGLTVGRVAFYNSSRTFLSYSSFATTFTTPANCAFIRLAVSGGNSTTKDYYNQFYLVEGDSRPTDVDRYQAYIPANEIELFGSYKSATNRLASLYNPTVKTAIGVYGDSNTAGLHSGATGTLIENCWANLLCARITEVFGVDVNIPAFGKWGTWRGGYYSSTIILESNNACFVHLNFYGSVLTINFGSTVNGVATIDIDGNSENFDTSSSSTYTASGLAETDHSVTITRYSGRPQISSITVHKYVTAENKGVSGQGSSSLPTTNTDYDIYLAVFGTNDRGSGSTNLTAHRYIEFANTQMRRGAEVIPIVPSPATDTFETGASAGIKMADIEAGIVKACGLCNLEPISFYQYLLDYCTYTGTSLNSLFNDTLHLTEAAHMLLYRFLCGKFGLGQPISDYLPT